MNGTQNKQWRHCREWHVIDYMLFCIEGKGVRIAPSNFVWVLKRTTIIETSTLKCILIEIRKICNLIGGGGGCGKMYR